MMGSIGVTVGVVGYLLDFCIELLSDFKGQAIRCAPSLTSSYFAGNSLQQASIATLPGASL